MLRYVIFRLKANLTQITVIYEFNYKLGMVTTKLLIGSFSYVTLFNHDIELYH
jgi:hypothetical protein